MGLRGLLSGITGLQSHSTWLDVIGNNLANVNTTAFKSSRVTFAEQISQALSASSGASPDTNMGGVNARAVGFGTKINAIKTQFQQGPLLSTGNAMDIAIDGDGFLMIQKGNLRYLTRAGALHLDGEGYLVDNNGGLVQGFSAQTQYRRNIINSISDRPLEPLAATDASLHLDTSNITDIGAIRITPGMTLPPKATSRIEFSGNLDSFQKVNEPGGVLDLAPGGIPSLPVGAVIMLMGPFWALDSTRITTAAIPGGGFALQQLGKLSIFNFGLSRAIPVINGGINLGFVQMLAGGYAWEQSTSMPPSSEIRTSVYDSLGNPREVTVQFYQVMDLGEAGINNPAGPCQATYAWYAFDTTGGASPATDNLIGGTGICEGDYNMNYYDRGTNRDLYIGDFLYFNTDGSLANSGCAGGPVPTPPGLPNYMTPPRIYMPPYNWDPPIGPIPTMGAEILAIELDFGSYGYIGQGKRDGIYSDVGGIYKIQDGVNRYVPNHTVFAESQDGYPEGTLDNLTIDRQGILKGFFTNQQIVDLAQIAEARVANPEGLNHEGDGLYSSSNNSGALFLGLPGQNGLGLIQSYMLEGSNVDLTVELSNMIVAQRGFEANGRTISTESENLAVLTNLGR